MFTSYAQNFEDVMLWRALREVEHGFYVDVGAYDPIVDSVSMGFYEKGWRGVHVEPLESCARRLRELRPDELVIQAAVGAARGTVRLFEVRGTGLSTVDRVAALRHQKAGFALHEIEVECLTLEEVLAPHRGKHIHWLKIDVEGAERAVLEGWGSAPAPWIVVIESTSPLTQIETHHEWEGLIVRRGYKFAYFDGVNRFYVAPEHPALVDAFRHGPAAFDNFALSGTTTAPYCEKLNARIRELQRRELEANGLARSFERRALDAEKHIAAMTATISWRITAPLRKLKQFLRRVAQRWNMRSALDSSLRVAVAFAKRTGLHAHVAPWMRERYPGMWARAKRMLLDQRPPVRSTERFAGEESGRAPIRNYVPHNSGDATLDAIATRGSISLPELQSLLEVEAERPRKR